MDPVLIYLVRLKKRLKHDGLNHLVPEGEIGLDPKRLTTGAFPITVGFNTRGGHAVTWLYYHPEPLSGNVTVNLDGNTPTICPDPLTEIDGFVRILCGIPGLEPPNSATMSRQEWVKKFGEVPACPFCGSPMRVVELRDGSKFWGCRKWKDAGCKGSLGIDSDGFLPPRCSTCSAPMRKRDGARGPFWGCTRYPACTRTMNGPTGDTLRTTRNDWMPEPGTTTLDRDSADGDAREAERTADSESGASKEAARNWFRKEDVKNAITPTGPGGLTFPAMLPEGTVIAVVGGVGESPVVSIGIDHGNTQPDDYSEWLPQRSAPPPEPVPQERENVTTVEDIRARFRKA